MTFRAFVNERAMDLPASATVRDAVRMFDPALMARIESGAGHVTDARGIEIPLDTPLAAGAILRAVVSARGTVTRPDADA